jgi:DNA-binding PadR family transcriptional regulator
LQDKILLGFLTNGEKTGYEIKKEMESSTNFFFNTSQGSINPAFKKLEKNGLVTSREEVEKGRLKKIFSITKKGNKAFLEWMNQDVPIPKMKGEILLRMFFFSKIAGNERAELIANYVSLMEENVIGLKKIMKYKQKVNADEFECDTVKFGIDVLEFSHNWFKDYVARLRQKKDC